MDKCRLCYTDPDPDMCQHIFNTKFEPPIWQIIEQLSNLIITEKDPYTKNICGPCFNNLVKYNDFREQILDTDYRIQHEKDQLSEKTSDDGDYFEVHCTPTRSDNDDFMIKEEKIEIEEDPLKIEDESNEELCKRSVAVMDNQVTKEFVIVGSINNIDKMTACYPSPKDNSNETNEIQSSICNTDDKIDFNRDSTKTDGSNIISTNNNVLTLTDNDMIISDENESSTAKDIVGSTTRRSNTRNDLHINLKVQNSKPQRKQTDKTPWKCNICNKQLSDRANLWRHKQVHMNEKRYRCNICNKQFTQTAYLHKHQLVHTGEKRHRCNICNKQFSQRTNLVHHERVHTGEKPFQCNICKKQFTQKVCLWNHERIHIKEKLFACEICNMHFSQRALLKAHIPEHKVEKRFICNICNKEFTHKGNFECHIRIHTGEKPYKCNMCDRSFRTQAHLDSHLRTHTGEKPFKCDVCNRAFTQHSAMTGHNRRMHGVEKS